MTIELSGKIEFQTRYDYFSKIKLVQSDGYKIDLISRIQEMTDSFGTTGQINYWISDKPKNKEEMIEGFLKKLYGAIEVELEQNYHYYSTLTGGNTTYDAGLKIGGHDLYHELADHDGDYIVIEFSFKEKD